MKHNTSHTKKHDLIVVLGLKLGPHWGMREDLKTQLRIAAKMYHELPGAHIAVCGKWSIWFDWLSMDPPITESQRMKTFLINHGVKHQDIVMESHSKDTIGNAYYLKRYIRTKPSYKHLLVICSEQHKKRVRFIFNTFFEKSYKIDYLPVAAPRFKKNTTADEKLCLAQQKVLLKHVRPGHDEDFKHELYNSGYYTHQAKQIKHARLLKNK